MMHSMCQTLRHMNEDRNRRETDSNAVRLNPLEMPVFNGRVGESLYRFIDQMSHFLNNCVHPTEWVARLKAAVQKDSRAYDSVVQTERTYAYLFRTEVGQTAGTALPPSREQWCSYYALLPSLKSSWWIEECRGKNG